MLIVALTSFGVGVLLRFGLPAVTEKGDPLWGLTNYVLNNKKMVELFVGVLLPVCMLFLFEVMLRSTDKGAKRLDTKRSESHAVIAAAEKKVILRPLPCSDGHVQRAATRCLDALHWFPRTGGTHRIDVRRVRIAGFDGGDQRIRWENKGTKEVYYAVTYRFLKKKYFT